jgi:hypothetical protein
MSKTDPRINGSQVGRALGLIEWVGPGGCTCKVTTHSKREHVDTCKALRRRRRVILHAFFR